jgi:hypothetical protein
MMETAFGKFEESIFYLLIDISIGQPQPHPPGRPRTFWMSHRRLKMLWSIPCEPTHMKWWCNVWNTAMWLVDDDVMCWILESDLLKWHMRKDTILHHVGEMNITVRSIAEMGCRSKENWSLYQTLRQACLPLMHPVQKAKALFLIHPKISLTKFYEW